LLHADGVVGQAEGGTLFIDEVGALGPAAQAARSRVARQERRAGRGGERARASLLPGHHGGKALTWLAFA
jgi:DNA-binding NtrC family response regulator